MKKTYPVLKVFLMVLLCLLTIAPYSAAFARDGGRGYGDMRGYHRGGGHYRSHREAVVVDHRRHYYHYGRFYRPGRFGFSYRFNAPIRGAFITHLPFGYSTVIVAGEPYYRYNHIYYRRHQRGYYVVPAPVIIAPPQVEPLTAASGSGIVTINVPNARGGYNAVTLEKRGTGYIGPQGEYYEGNPTMEQLRALYGN
ncbi:MAG: DUF6515 family protein [Candidatus Omnitrophota bacterium]